MNIIAWALLGIVAGAIAKLIYPGRQGGSIFSTMILGIIGSFLGGSLFTLLTKGTISLSAAGFSFPGLIVAIIGLLRSFGEKGRDRKFNERNTWVSEEAKILFHQKSVRVIHWRNDRNLLVGTGFTQRCLASIDFFSGWGII